MERVTILGSGAWGTALALTAARANCAVTLWGRNTDKLRNMPQLPWWDASIHCTSDLEQAMDQADSLIFALPAQTFRSFFTHNVPQRPVMVASKGIEVETGLLLSEVSLSLEWKVPICFLGGPHLAQEVAKGLPTSATVGVARETDWKIFEPLLQQSHFRVTPSQDQIGVQVVGALKNIFAILSGIIHGAKWGENARAAFLTQGFQEMFRFGKSLNAHPETFWSPAGLGDFMVTSLSLQSRNTQFGIRFVQGENPHPKEPLAEGFFTIQAVLKRAQEKKVHLPLIETLNQLLQEPHQVPHFLPRLLEILT